MASLFTGLGGVEAISPGVQGALVWAFPLIALMFIARWGLSLAFGRRR